LDIRWSVDRPGTRYWKPPGMSRAGLRRWVIIGVPQYPRYKTSTIAFEPFVERMAGATRSMGGRIGTHMLLQVPSQDRLTTMGYRGTTGVVTCNRSWDV
jgi:hypothetical protein